MKIACIGAGPAGLHSACLLARRGHQVSVYAREDERAGWGVVLTRHMFDEELDRETSARLRPLLHAWQQIEIHRKKHHELEEVSSIGGQDFYAIARSDLLAQLRGLALEAGVEFHPAMSIEQIDADLILACDGLHSPTRQGLAFAPQQQAGKCRYLWLGVDKPLPTFIFAFVETAFGWMQLHAYQYTLLPQSKRVISTCIVEMHEDVWQLAGFANMNAQTCLAFCQQVFAAYLHGAQLCLSDSAQEASAARPPHWQHFQTLTCRHWVHHIEREGRSLPVVLLGDAAHSAHFSIGSGTRLALQDAAQLAQQLGTLTLKPSPTELAQALQIYQAQQQLQVRRLQNAAQNSMRWFEQVALYAALPMPQFAYSLLTRSQRLSHASLAQRDPVWMADFLRKLHADARPPMFLPLQVRGLRLANRIVVSPMAQYAANDGVIGDYHLMHLGSLAVGGAALLITEMLAITPNARITPQCAGIYSQQQLFAWRRIVDFVHQHSQAKIGAQLGHAGAKGACLAPHQAIRGESSLRYDAPLPEYEAENEAWPLLAASSYAYRPGISATAHSISLEQMQQVLADFVAATHACVQAGFDWLELHCAHGYLLSSFLSPLTNQRQDEFGGSVAARCRFPVQVASAIRAAWPADKPMSVRLSVVDWLEGGNTIDDAVQIAGFFKQIGVDVITCSSGQVSVDEQVAYGRMYQTPFADIIRQRCGVLTMAVGAIEDGDQVNSIIAAGRADLCAIGRPHLANPHWTLQQAAIQAYAAQPWPAPYKAAQGQAEKNLSTRKTI